MYEAIPFEVIRDHLGCARHVVVQFLLFYRLTAHELRERLLRLSESLDYVSFEYLDRFLYNNQSLSVIVLLQDLLVQTVIYTLLDNAWVIDGIDIPTACIM